MRNRVLVYLFLVLTVMYVGLVLLAPADPVVLKRYDISELQARLLNLTVVIPIVGIWLVALYGFIRFRLYASLVDASNEGKALNLVAMGLVVLGFSLPGKAVVSSGFKYLVADNPDLKPTSIIITNYVGVIFSIIAFYLLARGALGLVRTLKRNKQMSVPSYFVPVIILLSSLFTWLILSRSVGTAENVSSYYLPNWLIITTLAVPYLLAWYYGILAFYYLSSYHKNVKGVLYKQAFSGIASGIAVIVFTSVLVQMLVTLGGQLSRLNLTPILALVYLLIILYAVGYGLVARGARKLKQIEEV
jgi:hypothetical protein